LTVAADCGRGPAERREHAAKPERETQAPESGVGYLGAPRLPSERQRRER